MAGICLVPPSQGVFFAFRPPPFWHAEAPRGYAKSRIRSWVEITRMNIDSG